MSPRPMTKYRKRSDLEWFHACDKLEKKVAELEQCCRTAGAVIQLKERLIAELVDAGDGMADWFDTAPESDRWRELRVKAMS